MTGLRNLIPVFFPILPFGIIGCSQKQIPAELPPTKVVVSKPIQCETSNWNTYTGIVESREVVEVRARVRGYIIKDYLKPVPEELPKTGSVPSLGKLLKHTPPSIQGEQSGLEDEKKAPGTQSTPEEKEQTNSNDKANGYIEEGSEVKKGTILFEIDPRPYQAEIKYAQGELDSWVARKKLAEQRIALLEPLLKQQAAAQQELDQALAEKSQAIGAIAAAKGRLRQAELDLSYCTIKAPIAGKVGRAEMTEGSLVESTGNNLLTTVVSMEPMYVYFNVNERDVQRYLKEAQKDSRSPDGKAPVEMSLATDADFPFKGYIDFVDNRVDPGTGTIKIRARFPNPMINGIRLLVPGFFARIRVRVGEPYKATMVADRAIITDQKTKYVLIVDENGQVVRRDIEPGRLEKSGLRIVKGLSRNERVIVSGLTLVRPGMEVETVEGKMPQRPTQ